MGKPNNTGKDSSNNGSKNGNKNGGSVIKKTSGSRKRLPSKPPVKLPSKAALKPLKSLVKAPTKTSVKIPSNNKTVKLPSTTPSILNKTKPKVSSNHGHAAAKATRAGKKIAESPKETLDRSQNNFPFDIRMHGVSSLINTLQKATAKVKKTLTDECDIIMECRYCKNLFRSTPNFLSHKQNYCRSAFSLSSENGNSQCIQKSSNPSEFHFNFSALNNSRVTPSKSLSSVITSSQVSQSDIGSLVAEEDKNSRSLSKFYSDINDRISYEKQGANGSFNDNHQVAFKVAENDSVNLIVEPIRNREQQIVYHQRRIFTDTDPNICDVSNQNCDTRDVISRDTAILGPDGKIICTGTEQGIEKIVKRLTAQIEISQYKMAEKGTNKLVEACNICKTVFDTQKALRQHRRDAPDCVKQSTSSNGNFGEEIAVNSEVEANSVIPSNSRREERAKANLFIRKLFSPSKKSSPVVGFVNKKRFPSPLKKISAFKSSSLRFDNNTRQYNSNAFRPATKVHEQGYDVLSANLRLASSSIDTAEIEDIKFFNPESFLNKKKRCSGIVTRQDYSASDRNSAKTVSKNSKQQPAAAAIKKEKESPSNVSVVGLPTEKSRETLELPNQPLSHTAEETAAEICSQGKGSCEDATAHSAILNSYKDRHTQRELDTVEHDNNNLEIETDRESLGNRTDSGISSTTASSEGHPDTQLDLQLPPDSNSEFVAAANSTRTRCITKSTHKGLIQDDKNKVLTPENKIPRPSITSKKRKSSRIEGKSTTPNASPIGSKRQKVLKQRQRN